MMTPETFHRIIGAARVEMQLGRYEFALTPAQIEAMRDLASRVKKPQIH